MRISSWPDGERLVVFVSSLPPSRYNRRSFDAASTAVAICQVFAVYPGISQTPAVPNCATHCKGSPASPPDASSSHALFEALVLPMDHRTCVPVTSTGLNQTLAVNGAAVTGNDVVYSHWSDPLKVRAITYSASISLSIAVLAWEYVRSPNDGSPAIRDWKSLRFVVAATSA